MKKILFVLVMIFSGLACGAQTCSELAGISRITLYGVDFSHTKVCFAYETPDEFISAFERINVLFLSESEKYVHPIERRLDRPVTRIDLDSSIKGLERIDRKTMMLKSTAPQISDEQIRNLVNSVDTKDGNETGLLIIAESLNKAERKGHFIFVLFDEQTRNIVSSWRASGNAGGFGLRNYWAGALHGAIKSISVSGVDPELSLQFSQL